MLAVPCSCRIPPHGTGPGSGSFLHCVAYSSSSIVLSVTVALFLINTISMRSIVFQSGPAFDDVLEILQLLDIVRHIHSAVTGAVVDRGAPSWFVMHGITLSMSSRIASIITNAALFLNDSGIQIEDGVTTW
jgi:hypothetical protein